jgi:putative chitinase
MSLLAFFSRFIGLLKNNKQVRSTSSGNQPNGGSVSTPSVLPKTTVTVPQPLASSSVNTPVSNSILPILTVEILQTATGCSSSVAQNWLSPFQSACYAYTIDTPNRLSAFLANVGVESASLTQLQEDLNYSAQGLADTWPSKFAVDPNSKPLVPNQLANSIARQPEQVANQAYANRYGNGDPTSGDGWTYRGRGPIQITFKDNYSQLDKKTNMGCLANPNLLLQPLQGALSAAWFFASLNPGCLTASDNGDISKVIQLINGAPPSDTNQGPLRISRYNAALKLFTN